MGSGDKRRHFRLGAASLTLGGAAFGLIQILQATIGAFSPRAIVSVLLALCIGLAGSTLGRARQRGVRARRFAGLLRVWPLRRIADSDGLALGVFPPRELATSDGLPRYVPREIDAPLREAMRAGGLVVVVGPERSGKSRTALEAARDAIGEREVVVPVDGAALGDLADDAWSGFGADAVWWLDDLERFLDHLGGVELSVLLDQGRTVVATVREERWQELMRAVGDDGERGRRLRAGARVFRLSADVNRASVADVARALGGLDVSRGLAAALSAPGEGAAPREAEPRGRRRPDPVLMLSAAATLATGAALAAVIAGAGFAPVKPPPLGAQIDAIRRQAAAAGKTTMFARADQLHGLDQTSYVFVLRPALHGSDELRIYDLVDGFLRLRLDFQPRTQGTRALGAAVAVASAEQQRHGVFDYGLSQPQVLDAFGNGEHELVADYTELTEGAAVRLPIIVAWDDLGLRYRLAPLLPAATDPPLRFGVDESLRGPYLLRATAGRRVISAWGAGAYEVIPASASAPATLTIARSVTDRRGDLGVAVSDETMTPSPSGQVELAPTCSAEVVTNPNLDPAEILRVAAGQAPGRLSIAPGTAPACAA